MTSIGKERYEELAFRAAALRTAVLRLLGTSSQFSFEADNDIRRIALRGEEADTRIALSKLSVQVW